MELLNTEKPTTPPAPVTPHPEVAQPQKKKSLIILPITLMLLPIVIFIVTILFYASLSVISSQEYVADHPEMANASHEEINRQKPRDKAADTSVLAGSTLVIIAGGPAFIAGLIMLIIRLSKAPTQ